MKVVSPLIILVLVAGVSSAHANHYQRLGLEVGRNYSLEELQQATRHALDTIDGDAGLDDGERAIQRRLVSRAFIVLSEPDQKAEYDRGLVVVALDTDRVAQEVDEWAWAHSLAEFGAEDRALVRRIRVSNGTDIDALVMRTRSKDRHPRFWRQLVRLLRNEQPFTVGLAAKNIFFAAQPDNVELERALGNRLWKRRFNTNAWPRCYRCASSQTSTWS